LIFTLIWLLTTLNTAKAMHWFDKPKEQRPPFSMADIKNQYVNELLLDRLIIIYGKDPPIEKNNPSINILVTTQVLINSQREYIFIANR
jgi:hypothetical protein